MKLETVFVVEDTLK